MLDTADEGRFACHRRVVVRRAAAAVAAALALSTPAVRAAESAQRIDAAAIDAVELDAAKIDTTDVETAAAETTEEQPHRRLPFLGEQARAKGYELPLAFGAAVVLTRLGGRRIDVTDVRIGVEGDPQSVSDVLGLGSTSDVFNANVKLDAWLLPFLNVYTLLGYVHNDSTTHARVTLPRPGPIPGNEEIDAEIQTDLSGFIGGLGVTLAGGYKSFYVVADCNYDQTDLGFDDDFKALIASVRAGWNGKAGRRPVQVWLGVGNWDTAATAKGHTDLGDGRTLVFEADQRPHTYWMYDIGANLELSERYQLVVDAGFDFDGGYFLVVGPTLRF